MVSTSPNITSMTERGSSSPDFEEGEEEPLARARRGSTYTCRESDDAVRMQHTPVVRVTTKTSEEEEEGEGRKGNFLRNREKVKTDLYIITHFTETGNWGVQVLIQVLIL
jgi:hypothetical protein